jgi:dTDP-4-amino-4,6-dideoxygalactose transaminase
MKIPLFRIYWDKNDIEAVNGIIRKGKVWANGPEAERFEHALAKYVGTKYAVTFNSGTSALHSAMEVLGIGEGDEVIVPPFTFIATVNTPMFVGAEPVFADIEEETFGLDPEDVLRKITKRTKAIIPVHYGGKPCKIQELKEIADDYGLFLVEDACEALGAKVGTFGHMSVFSFCQNKIITTGEGGAITTDYKPLYESLKLIRSHGGENGFGYNFRMPEMLASLGLSQLKKIKHNIIARRKIAERILGEADPENVYQLLTIRSEDRDSLQEHLKRRGIETKVYFKALANLPIANKVSKEVLSLPCYPDLTHREVDYIIKQIWRIKY